MDGQYGIAVTNKFCLLEEGEDILDVTNQKLEAQKVEKENAAKLPKTKAKVVKKTTFEKRNDNNKTNLEKSKNEKNLKFNNRDNDNRRGRGGFRGRGRGRGGADGGFDRNGKRDFDRHSGNDRSGPNKTASKREGLGSHNWGSNLDELNADNAADESLNKTVDGDVSRDETEEVAPVEEAPPAELSLNEYRAMQKANTADSGFKVRQAGEGVDNKQWEKTYILKKENFDEEETEFEEYERSGRTKNFVDIEIKFSDNSRGRGGGGGFGRGGFRGGNRGFRGNSGFRRSGRDEGENGDNNDAPAEQTNGFAAGQNGTPRGRGRGNFRGGNRGSGRGGFAKSRVSVPNVSNERDFPTLGA